MKPKILNIGWLFSFFLVALCAGQTAYGYTPPQILESFNHEVVAALNGLVCRDPNVGQPRPEFTRIEFQFQTGWGLTATLSTGNSSSTTTRRIVSNGLRYKLDSNLSLLSPLPRLLGDPVFDFQVRMSSPDGASFIWEFRTGYAHYQNARLTTVGAEESTKSLWCE